MSAVGLTAAFIDQTLIDAPAFPRGQDWWTRFLPGWADATVRDDGTVVVTAGTPGQRAAIADWLTGKPQLTLAVRLPAPRVRFRRSAAPKVTAGEYAVQVQHKPRGRWVHAGIVCSFGDAWAALGDGDSHWTGMHKTRHAAVAELLKGDTR